MSHLLCFYISQIQWWNRMVVCFEAAMIRGLCSQNLNIDHLTNVFGGHLLNWFHPHIWALFKRYLWIMVSSWALVKGGGWCKWTPFRSLFCLIYNIVCSQQSFLSPFFFLTYIYCHPWMYLRHTYLPLKSV